MKHSMFCGYRYIHSSHPLRSTSLATKENAKVVPSANDSGKPKLKRWKLKGKRAVIRWVKYFRHQKKKEFERMTPDEKILFKLKKARKKEERLATALEKIDPPDESMATHDPEVLTPEEYFYFLKMGKKCKNYVPVGRRGIFQGVILNMHLHWKKHETLKVIVKTFTTEEVKEIAAELARLSGGIVLEIEEENTIIMYRGKNYSQPPPEIMSPRETLSKRKALLKSRIRDELNAVRNYIPRLEREFEDLQAQMKLDGEKGKLVTEHPQLLKDMEAENIGIDSDDTSLSRNSDLESPEALEDTEDEGSCHLSDDNPSDSITISESEDLSDIFETDADEMQKDEQAGPLYLDALDKLHPEEKVDEPEDFEEHLRKIASLSDRPRPGDRELRVSDLDEIDKIFLRATKLFKKSK